MALTNGIAWSTVKSATHKNCLKIILFKYRLNDVLKTVNIFFISYSLRGLSLLPLLPWKVPSNINVEPRSLFLTQTCTARLLYMREKQTIIVSMQRYVKNILPLVKYVLSTLPMMNVPVNNDGFLFGLWNKIIRSYSNIIEKRKSVRLILHATVVAWGSDQADKIFWVFWDTVLNGQNDSFNCRKGSIKSLFHVISIDIDEHLGFWNTLAPHTLNEIEIPLTMDFDDLLQGDFVDFFIMDLELFPKFWIIMKKFCVFCLFQVTYHLSDTLWSFRVML